YLPPGHCSTASPSDPPEAKTDPPATIAPAGTPLLANRQSSPDIRKNSAVRRAYAPDSGPAPQSRSIHVFPTRGFLPSGHVAPADSIRLHAQRSAGNYLTGFSMYGGLTRFQEKIGGSNRTQYFRNTPITRP